MENLIELDKATLRFNQENNAIELIWKKPQDKDTFKRLFTEGVEYLKKYKATNWLSDIRNEGVVGPEASHWLQTEIIPRGISYGLQKIAVVMDPDVFKKFYVNKMQESIERGNEMMQYFDSVESANEWLLSNSN